MGGFTKRFSRRVTVPVLQHTQQRLVFIIAVRGVGPAAAELLFSRLFLTACSAMQDDSGSRWSMGAGYEASGLLQLSFFIREYALAVDPESHIDPDSLPIPAARPRCAPQIRLKILFALHFIFYTICVIVSAVYCSMQPPSAALKSQQVPAAMSVGPLSVSVWSPWWCATLQPG